MLPLLLEKMQDQRATETHPFIQGTRRIQETRTSALLRRLFSNMNVTRESLLLALIAKAQPFRDRLQVTGSSQGDVKETPIQTC